MSAKFYVAEGWNDITTHLNQTDISNQTNAPDLVPFIGNMRQYAFDATVEEELFAQFHMPHDYSPDTNIFPHIHWTTSDTNVGEVRWGIELTWAKGHSQDAFTNTMTIFINQEAGGIDRTHHIAEQLTGVLGGGTIEPDTILLARVFRDATHVSDTYPSDAFGLTVDLHYQVDRNSTPQRKPNFYDQPYVQE
jgi:hypothetical protein